MEKINKNKEILRVESLSKSYDKAVIFKDISFSVYEGEKIVITGRSGAGKSTLLSILGTLEKQSEGDLYFDGKLVKNANAVSYRKYNVGFMFQDGFLIEEFTIYENILTSMKLVGNKENPMKYLDMVDLSDKAKSMPGKISGGQARRASLARALAKRPKLLLLDEPTEGLDDITALEIIELVEKMCREQHITMIMVTHNKSFASRMDRVLILENGKITEAVPK